MTLERDIQRMANTLTLLGKGLDEAAIPALLAGGQVVVNKAKTDHLYKDITGTLTRSMYSQLKSASFASVIVEVGSTAEHAPGVEYGHSMGDVPRFVPGKFVNRRGGKVFMYDPEAGGGIMIKAARAKPYPFLMPALEGRRTEVLQLLALGLSRAILNLKPSVT